jgi:O-antigen ligase
MSFEAALPLGAGPAVPPPDVVEPPPSWRSGAAATLVVVGAFAVVLAGVDSMVFDLDRYLVPKALVLHLTALGLFLLGFPSLKAPRWGMVEWLLIAFVGWSAASAALASNRWLALEGWAIGLSSLVLLLALRDLSARHHWPVLIGVITAVVVGAALGVAQAYGADWEFLGDSRPPGGTFGNRNFLAHLSVLAMTPLAVTVVRVRHRRWLLPALLGIVILAAAVVLTRSRAAWLGGIGGLATAALTLIVARWGGVHRSRWRLVAVAAALAIAAVAAVLLPNQLDWTTDSPYAQTLSRLTAFGEGSGRGRLIQYRNSIGLTKEDPVLGVGPGNWFVHYPRVASDGDPSYAGHQSIPTNPWPSSDWVAFLTERGVLGALLLLVTGLSAAGRVLSRARSPQSDDAYAAAAVVGLMATAVITGMFDAVLLLAAPSYLVWSITGLMLPEPKRAIAWMPGSGMRALAKTGAVLLLLVAVAEASAHTVAIASTAESRNRATLTRAALLAPGEHRVQLLLAERGDCKAAERVGKLMPHHEHAQQLARRC